MMNFKDIYKFPLVMEEFGDRVNDNEGQWVFDFTLRDKNKQKLLLDVINGTKTLKNNNLSFHHKEGYICDNKGGRYILIRGWSNLIGVKRLSEEQASLVQDTLAEYIVEQLNKRDFVEQDLEDFLTHLGVNITDKGKVKLLKDEVQLSMSYNMESYTKEEVIKEVIRCQLKEIECLLKIGIYKLKRI